MASIKLNSKAVCLLSLFKLAPKMVEPDREMPGRMASACQEPILKACGIVKFLEWLSSAWRYF